MSDPESNFHITFRRAPAALRRAALERFARRLSREVARGREFGCLVTGDAEIRKLNERYRGKNAATDVLSFPADREPGSRGVKESTGYLGDIVISLARARAQAAEYGHALEKEVQVLMLHGLLHLMGYDHETDAGRMRRAENRWRAKLGLPAGLIDRVQA